jgi:hypothetical protein
MIVCCLRRDERPRLLGRFVACAWLLCASMSAHADRVEIQGRALDAQHQPVAGQPLRIVLDADDDRAAPDAGRRRVSDADGRFELHVDWTPRRRWVFGGSLLMVVPVPARADYLGLGVETESFGRKRLSWLHIDWLSTNAATSADAIGQGADGRFDIEYRHDGRAGDYFVDRPDQRFTHLDTPIALESIERLTDAQGGPLWRLQLHLIHHPANHERSP